MALDDRDWYRDALREKQRYTERARTRVKLRGSERVFHRPLRRGGPGYLTPLIWALFFGIVSFVVYDMSKHGAPLTWAGFKWWLSLWSY